MGKTNPCLRRVYIILTSLAALISALLLAATLFAHGYMYEDEELEELMGSHPSYPLSIITLLLAIIGVYGASKGKMWALILHAVGMILAAVVLFVFSMIGVATVNLVGEAMEREFAAMLPLSNISRATNAGIAEMQTDFECCGVKQGYQDWGYNISESCLCAEDATHPCVAAPRNSSLFEQHEGEQPVMIYSEPCTKFIITHVMYVFRIMLGVLLGLTAFWILTSALAITLVCQLRRKVDVPAVVYSPEAKAGNYTVLTDATDCT